MPIVMVTMKERRLMRSMVLQQDRIGGQIRGKSFVKLPTGATQVARTSLNVNKTPIFADVTT